jgi:hypothetical protein
MARTCDQCGKPVGDKPLIYLARKVQFDFGSRECEQKYAASHKTTPYGPACDYCEHKTGNRVVSNPRLSIRFGKYTVDYCCPAHRTEWFREHKPQEQAAQNVTNFRLYIHTGDTNNYEVCGGVDPNDVADACEAYDLVDLGDFIGIADVADLASGGIPVFRIIRMVAE